MDGASESDACAALRRAVGLLNERRLDEAEVALRAAEEVGADANECAGARWFLAMLRGDFEAAWRASDLIRARGEPDVHRLWNGEPLAGQRVMVRCLHGFGDAVQMLRLLPLVRALAAYVIVQVAPALVPLARCLSGADEVVTWAEVESSATEPAWDVQVEVMELPYLLRVTVGQLPRAERYLRLPEEALRRAVDGLGGAGRERLRVGLVWAAGGWNPSRSIPVTYFEELLGVADVAFWSLQGPGASGEADALFARGVLLDRL